MELEFAYKKLLADEKITEAELPEDAKIGIKSIFEITKAISMSEKKGNKISDRVLAKLKAQDKWVVREILDFIEEKDTNKEEMPADAGEVIEEIKIDEIKNEKLDDVKKADEIKKDETVAIDPKGTAIDEELKALLEAGKTKFTLEELKSAAKKSYDVVFENYDNTGDNGIETSHYRLLEIEDKQFELSKI